MPDRPLRFLWFGSYSRGAGYPRNDTLVEGLRELGHEVEELHVPLFRDASQRYCVEDLGSLNGTWLGSQQIKEAALHPAAELRVGATRLRLQP